MQASLDEVAAEVDADGAGAACWPARKPVDDAPEPAEIEDDAGAPPWPAEPGSDGRAGGAAR